MPNDETADKTLTKNPGATTLQQSFIGVSPDIPISSNQTMRAMDVSAPMATAFEGMTLQQSTYHITTFDCRTPALKEFLQDVVNGVVYVTESTEPAFIIIIPSKLKGTARKSIHDKKLRNIQGFISRLKKRFAPTKKYNGTSKLL